MGRGDGTFANQSRFNVGLGPRSIVTGDFNNDGWADLAVANKDSNDVSILLGLGNGSFATQFRIALDAFF